MTYLILTFDVESCLGEEEISQALPYTLDILSKYPEIKCTFNVPGRSVLIDKNAVCRILNEGHEVAAHGYRHDMNWDSKGRNEQEELIVKAKEILQSELETEVVGWATPRGGRHSADVGLLKKHGFLYVRDRSYPDYARFVPPQITDNFADIPRFGHDETTFMKTSFVQHILKKTALSNRFFKRRPDWQHHQIYRYLKNMLDYKMNIEQTYLVTNLHPYHIWRNAELVEAFDNFLRYVSDREDITAIPMKNFARGLIKGEIAFQEKNPVADLGGSTTDSDISIERRPAPDIALVFNSSSQPFSGSLVVKTSLANILILVIDKLTGLLKISCERSKEVFSYRSNLRRR